MERRLAAIFAADVVGYSRMMGEDEAGTLAALQSLRSELIDPAVAQHHGRIVKLMGDGVLIEFNSIVEAVQCAAEVQRDLAARNRAAGSKDGLSLRIGVHLGDVIVDQDDIYGDGVNIAARLEGIAPAGGICMSRQAFDQVEQKLALPYRSLGPRTLKNIARPVEVYAVNAEEFDGNDTLTIDGPPMRQEIAYCRAPDGVRLAYAKVGNGPPLVKTANWMNHLEYDWENAIFRPLLIELARNHTLLRYDARGNGMSDWDVDELSLDAWVEDLKAVADCAGLDRFPLFAMSQGCAVSVAFAVRYPERVSRLVLYGGFALGGKKRKPEEKQMREAMTTLMRLGWGTDDPTFRQLFTGQFIPGATREQMDSFNELQRRTTSAACAARYFDLVGDLDVRSLLGQVKAPTLVMHVRGDLIAPFEVGRELAAGIPGARFVALQGQNHLPLQHEPATQRLLEETRLFLRA